MSTPTIANTPGLLDALRTKLVRHEGYRTCMYRDSRGIPTIGIGFNMMQPGAQTMIARCGASYLAVYAGGAALTDEQVNCLYQQCVISVMEWMTKLLPELQAYSLNRQVAVLDMGFNLGPARFSGFRNMIQAVRDGRWTDAATEALQSEWATEVGERASEDAQMLAEG